MKNALIAGTQSSAVIMTIHFSFCSKRPSISKTHAQFIGCDTLAVSYSIVSLSTQLCPDWRFKPTAWQTLLHDMWHKFTCAGITIFRTHIGSSIEKG